jgi:hypothetical protein
MSQKRSHNENRKYFEPHYNELAAYQNLLITAKAVPIRKFMVQRQDLTVLPTMRKQDRLIINDLNFKLRKVEKEQQNELKKVIMVRVQNL